MSRRKKEPITAPAEFQADLRFLKPDKHSAILFLPISFQGPIGLVIAHWGHFEGFFDKVLKALLAGEAAEGIEREDIRAREFKRRRALLKDVCKEWLAKYRPAEAAELSAIADRAGDLYRKRNYVAHGFFEYVSENGVATGFKAALPSVEEKMALSEDILKKIYHDIAHLTADLMICADKVCHLRGYFVALPDRYLLEAAQETSHPKYPNREIPWLRLGSLPE